MEYGLIGKKLGHSFSKEIHEQIGKYNYQLVELNESEFETFMKQKDFKAINVTIPYKEKVISYLDYVSDTALKIKAVNTIVNKNGKLYGYNTDYLGLKEMLNHFNFDLSNKTIMILGTGGTSKTSSVLAKDLNCKEIIYVSRNQSDNCVTYESIDLVNNKVDILINTTPVEMYPNIDNEVIKSIDNFTNLKGIIDVIFNPLRTNLLLKAKDKNIKYCSGLFMLVAQAFYAIEIFLDKKLDKSLILKTYKNILNSKQNIVLIGMPSCGKSTIGKQLSNKLNKEFVDVDELIINKINMDIASFFKLYSEDKFREIESEVIKELASKNNLIISTGGGSILNKDNVKNLSYNGKLIFVDRPLEFLVSTSDRPLSSSIDSLKKQYEKRYPIYNKICDKKVINDGLLEKVISVILEDYYE